MNHGYKLIYISQMVYKWSSQCFPSFSKQFWKIFTNKKLVTSVPWWLISTFWYLLFSLTIFFCFSQMNYKWPYQSSLTLSKQFWKLCIFFSICLQMALIAFPRAFQKILKNLEKIKIVTSVLKWLISTLGYLLITLKILLIFSNALQIVMKMALRKLDFYEICVLSGKDTNTNIG